MRTQRALPHKIIFGIRRRFERRDAAMATVRRASVIVRSSHVFPDSAAFSFGMGNPRVMRLDLDPMAANASLKRLGQNIRVARKRREMREVDLADRAGISRHQLRRVEAGHPGTAVGAYVAVLTVLGFDHELRVLGTRDWYDGLPNELIARIKRIRIPTDPRKYDQDMEDPSWRVRDEEARKRRALRRGLRDAAREKAEAAAREEKRLYRLAFGTEPDA